MPCARQCNLEKIPRVTNQAASIGTFGGGQERCVGHDVDFALQCVRFVHCVRFVLFDGCHEYAKDMHSMPPPHHHHHRHYRQDGRSALTLAIKIQGVWRAFCLPPHIDEQQAVKVQAWLLQHLKGQVSLPSSSASTAVWNAPVQLQAAAEEHQDPEQRLLSLMAAFRLWGKSFNGDSSTYPGVYWVGACGRLTAVLTAG